MIWGLLELFQADYNPEYLNEALHLCSKMVDLFWDEDAGGFFLSGKGSERLILNPKDVYDGAIPSGNSAGAHVLGTLARMSGSPVLEEKFRRQLGFLAGEILQQPAACSFGLTAAMPALYPSREIVCVAAGETEQDEFKNLLSRRFLANAFVLLKTPENSEALARAAGFTAACERKENLMTVYFCENNTCALPITNLQELKKKISNG